MGAVAVILALMVAASYYVDGVLYSQRVFIATGALIVGSSGTLHLRRQVKRFQQKRLQKLKQKQLERAVLEREAKAMTRQRVERQTGVDMRYQEAKAVGAKNPLARALGWKPAGSVEAEPELEESGSVFDAKALGGQSASPAATAFFDGIFQRFNDGSERERIAIYRQYMEYLQPSSEGHKFVDYSGLTLEGRYCLLPALISSKGTLGDAYTGVSFQQSDYGNHRIVYYTSHGVIDADLWRKNERLLRTYLGADYSVHETDGTKLVLTRRDLPFEMPLSASHLVDGGITIGCRYDTKKPHVISMRDMTHMLVMGISGMGKSVFLNQVMQGVLYNMRYVEACYLVDLKGGVELFPYAERNRRISVVYRYEGLSQLVRDLVAKMYQRLDDMRQRGVKMWDRGLIFFIVDEYSQIQLFQPTTKAQKDAHAQLLADLNSLSMLGRAAGVKIIAQLQKGTTDVMASSFRNNLQSQVCFRVRDNLTAAGMFGSIDNLPVGALTLKRGDFIMYDDACGQTFHARAYRVPDDFEGEMRDVAARPE